MTSYNPENERLKWRYFRFLRDAKRKSEASIDAVASALDRFERFTGFASFKTFEIDQAIAFKGNLAIRPSEVTGAPLSKATVVSTLAALKAFFLWLADEPGFRRKVKRSDAEYFNASEHDLRVARAAPDLPVPTLDQIRQAIAAMPRATVIERRDRAIVAFILLTGARDGAVVTLKLKHVRLADRQVDHDARDVHVKFSRSYATWFFPVGREIEDIVAGWVAELFNDHAFGLDDPLFPATKVEQGASHQFQATGLSRRAWASAESIRRIFRAAFARIGLPYFNPHSFRKTLGLLGEQICRSPEEFKAWSQNLGHVGVMTTFMSYGKVAPNRQAEIIANLGQPRVDSTQVIEQIRRLVAADG